MLIVTTRLAVTTVSAMMVIPELDTPAQVCLLTELLLIRTYMYYRETSICIPWIILCNSDILIFYISVILYLFAGGYKCRLTTFPTRFAHGVSIFLMLSLLSFNAIELINIISYHTCIITTPPPVLIHCTGWQNYAVIIVLLGCWYSIMIMYFCSFY